MEKTERVKANPYVERSYKYPERLFNFYDFDKDLALVKNVFNDAKYIYVEFGSGSGGHLIDLAESLPGAHCIGFEIRYKRAVRTIEKSVVRNINNTWILRTDGNNIDKVFDEASIDRIYVNFPDPWSRPREWKHRTLSERFLDKCSKLLKPSGQLWVKTDHEEYFRSFLKKIKRDNRFTLLGVTEDLYSSEFISDNIVTEFESLFISQGLPIYHLRGQLK